MKNLEFENYFELLALHKSLMAVKFDECTRLPEAQGSPFTASLAFKIFDLLVEFAGSEGKPKLVEDWLIWQVADNSRMETKLLLTRIAESSWWPKASEEEKQKYVIDFMAPLKLEPETQNKIIKSS